MVRTIVVFIPLFACLFAMISHTMLAFRVKSYTPLMWLLLMFGAFLFTDSCYAATRVPHIVLVRATQMAQFTAPSIVPLVIMYYRRSRRIGRKEHPLEMLWLIVPATLFGASGILYILAGEPAVEAFMQNLYDHGYSAASENIHTPLYLYFIVSTIVFRIVMAIEAIWLAAYLVVLAIKDKFSLRRLWSFFFKGGSIKLTGLHTLFIVPALLVIIAKFAIFRDVLTDYPVAMLVFSLIMTICIIGFSYTALFASRRTISLREMKYAMRYNYSPENKSIVVDVMMNSLLQDADAETKTKLQGKLNDSLPTIQNRPEPEYTKRPAAAEKLFAPSDDQGTDKILDRFQKLIREEMPFLQPRLTLEDVAERLGTNKFYISKMVNNNFGMGFPELINILRVDFAEQYMMEHGNAKQEEIARQSGFLSASSFNTIFKKVTGVTPKVWMAAKEHSE